MRVGKELLTPAETSIISGAPIKAVYKAARERLPRRLIVRRQGKVYFPLEAAVCVYLDHALPKAVPVEVRKALYGAVQRDPGAMMLEHTSGPLNYRLDASAAKAAVDTGLETYRRAMATIAEDPEIQAGAATFSGTRILVHTIADLLKAGAPASELKEDYPNLTDAMIEAAGLYARAHPRRGRPKTPAWRSDAPAAVRRHKRSMA